MSRTGYSQWHTPEAGGTPPWRGLSLWRTTDQTVAADGTAAIAFNTIKRDTDSIASTGSETLGGITFPTGSCGIVPAGMDGLWAPSLTIGVYPDAVGGDVSTFKDTSLVDWSLITTPVVLGCGVYLYVNDDQVWVAGMGGLTLPSLLTTMAQTPEPIELVEGDKVGFAFVNATTILNGSDPAVLIYGGGGLGATRMLFQYLGPAPAEPS